MKNIVFINAGAGSGKTYRLTEILTENIERKVCRADQVILTTFTNKAADEFRARARKALLAKNLTEEANLLASAAMGTVHSVARQLIHKYWYHLGIGVELNVMEESDVDFFMNQALANIPTAEQIETLSKIATQLHFMDEFTVDEERWKKDLKSILDLALSNGIIDFTESLNLSRSILNEFYREEDESPVSIGEIHAVLNEINQLLPQIKESGGRNNSMKKIKRFLPMADFDNASLYDILSFLNSNELPAEVRRLPAVQTLQNQLAQPHRFPGATGLMKEYQDILFKIADRSLDSFRRYKDENKLTDFNDMEIKLLDLLSDPETRDDIRNSYKQLYVDEFQDSSPIQVDIFTKLSEIVEHSWWVGDPKQSIFGFRGTDPMLIKAVTDEFIKKDPRNLKLENLPYSWRSRPEIVKFDNNLFRSALASQVGDPDKIALKPVRKGDRFPTGVSGNPLRHWHHAIEGRFSIQGENDMISGSVRTLLQTGLKAEDPVRSSYDENDPSRNIEILKDCNPGDVAILRLQNKHISSLAATLRSHGSEVAAFELGLDLTAEIQLLMAMLNYLLDKSDNRAKAIVLLLSGSFPDPAGLLDDRLRYLNADKAPEKPDNPDKEDDTEEYAHYLDYSLAWKADNPLIGKIDILRDSFALYDIPSLTEIIIHATGLPDLVSRWNNADQRRNNLLTAVRFAEKYSQQCKSMKLGASVNGFIQYLKHLPEKELTQSAATGKNAVNIVTYFKAKGLEWPVVVLADLYNDDLEEKSLITRDFHGVHLEIQKEFDLEHPLKGRHVVLLPSPLSDKAIPEELRRNITESDRFRLIRQKVEEELKRLLYVGMTRARDYLITTSVGSKRMAWIENVTGLTGIQGRVGLAAKAGSADLDLFDTGCNIPVEIIKPVPGSAGEERETGMNFIFRKENAVEQDDPRYRSPSSEELPAGLKVNVEVVRDFNIRITQSMKDREDELGNCLHGIFYHFSPDTGKAEFIEKAGRIIDQYGLTPFIPEPSQVHDAINALFGFLKEKYGGFVQIYRELPLHHARDGYIFSGSADLLWETEKGLILIDYKSFPGTKAQVMEPTNEHYAGHYAGQLYCYGEMIEATCPGSKKILETLIYYPVTGVIVKLTLQ